MQFNSFVFILLLLPVTILAYFLANRIKPVFGKIILIISSAIFYTYSDKTAFIIMGISLLVNFTFSLLIKRFEKWHKLFLFIPVTINVGLLLYFKYLNFFITTANRFTGHEWALQKLILPLGISFFTFQQIAYIVSVHNKELTDISLIDYLAYILYFPKVLMGPLMEPSDFMTQLNDITLKKVNWDHIACGVKIFSLGLFKKVMLADVFAKGVAWGFSNVDAATSMDWILVTLFYTFEIYFDFSGYSDMATGTSLMLNISLPVNFDSPYKALSIRDFWKRWHISLTRFFTKYIYIPLGGSRRGKLLTYVNTMIVFLISGFWHGANWTFILWGILHGIFMIIDRMFEKSEEKLFEPVRWCLTFSVINVLWLLFRAESIGQWKHIIKIVLSLNSTAISSGLIECFKLPEAPVLEYLFHLTHYSQAVRGFWMIIYLLSGLGICLIPENNFRTLKKISPVFMVLAAIAFVWGFVCLSSESVFVYFNF